MRGRKNVSVATSVDGVYAEKTRLDAVGNELESFRLETMYLAGAADYEKLFK